MTATAAPTSRKLPAGWHQTGRGIAFHGETGTTVEKSMCGWAVCVPGPAGSKHTVQIIHQYFPTRAAAIDAAAPAIAKTRQLIVSLWNEAHFAIVGRPSTWPLGEADAETVTARREAVAAAGTPTGATAAKDQLVVHIVTGTPGRLHGTITYDRPFHGLEPGTYAAVTFASAHPFPVPVHPDDVVAITDDHLICRRTDMEGHTEHWDVENPTCLIEQPDADLEGPELELVRDREYEATDGVAVRQNLDGTWWAYGPSLTGIGADSICSGQATLGRTYRIINRWRASHALQHRIIAAYVKIAGWRSPEVRLAEIRAELGDVDAEAFDWAVRQIRDDAGAMLLSIEAGKPVGADDLEAAITTAHGDMHTITIWGHVLQAWAETAGRTPAIDGREIYWGSWSRTEQTMYYRDTRRPVDEPMPTHVIIHVITDRAAYADHLQADAEQKTGFRDELLRIAAEVRDGTRLAREPYDEHFRDAASAEKYATSLRRYDDGTPGRSYEVVEVAGTSACVNCHHPVLLIDGTWRHFTNRFPTACPGDGDSERRTATPKDSGPGPDGQGPDTTQTLTPTPTLTPATAPTAATPSPDSTGPDSTGPDSTSPGPIAFGFRIQTLTGGGGWRTVRRGFTPPTFRPDPDLLNAVAGDILGNAGPVLGLGPQDPVPTVKVQTWHRASGLTGSARNHR